MPLDHHSALRALAQDAGDLFERVRRARPDICFVEIEQDVGGQFDARLSRGLLDRQVLRLTGEVLYRVDQVENLALHLLRPRR